VIVLEGVPLSPGIARGKAMIVRAIAAGLPSSREDGRPQQEQFRTARRRAEAELRSALDALAETAGAAREILHAHLILLSDPMLEMEVVLRIERDGIGASEALDLAAASLSGRFEVLADPAMQQRAADLRDICECIRRQLAGCSPIDRSEGADRIVCATDLSPAQVLRFARDRPLAFVLEQGTDTSHAAILVRALAVPAVIRVSGANAVVQDGDVLVVDGNRGHVFVHPDSDVVSPAGGRFSAEVDETDAQPAHTCDGVAIAVTASIAHSEDARRAIATGADGIGLLRTEMLFLLHDRVPSEDVQEAFYREICGIVGSRALTIRLLDLGADKQAPGLELPHETNPALGLRGIRLLFTRPELLMCQLRALLRATAGRRVRLLLPMVLDATDLARLREILNEAAVGMRSTSVEIGAMVETPAAALMADELAAAADFLSVGTNDLAQYVLAADRYSAQMASTYQPLHPAVLRLVRGVTAAAARHRTPVCVCGEAAADPRALPLFIGMGVTELSVPPPAVARVKAQVRRINMTAARALAEDVVSLPNAAAVAARIDAAREIIGADVLETRDAR
jgi:phosphoenolpyruvate-protein phosphotransferase